MNSISENKNEIYGEYYDEFEKEICVDENKEEKEPEEEEKELITYPEPISVCKCLIDGDSTQETEIPLRKKTILSTVSRTEEYLRVRRIPELLRYLLTKIIAHSSPNPVAFLETLLDECMLFRAGHGPPPVLYETRHLQAVIKSFDPGNRGWLSAGQFRRAFTTLGLTPKANLPDKIPCDEVLEALQTTQEKELLKLLSAGTMMVEEESTSASNEDSQISNTKLTTLQ